MPAHALFRRHRSGRAFWIATPVAIALLLLGAWGIDVRGQRGHVARNVALGGHGVGGDTRDELAAEVSRQADAARLMPVHIVTPHASYDTTAEAMGLSMDQPATIGAVMKVGHKDNVFVRPFAWVASIVSERKVTPVFQIDRRETADGAHGVEGSAHVDPTEPSITASASGAVQVVPGKPGVGIEPNLLADALVAAAPHGSSTKPIEVHVDQGSLSPHFTDADAQRVADEASTLAHHSLTLTVGSETKPLDPAAVAAWLRAVPKDDALALGIDNAATIAGISATFGTVAQAPVDASFTVEGDKPVLHPSQDGVGCCEPNASLKVFAALQTNTPMLTLSVVTQRPTFTTEAAQQLGIVEEVGQPDMFGPTTHHACCQSRVTNIHLIADIVRGHVIKPGETFSVNGFVGQRTMARGFVDAPVIYDATEDHDIGGGVSQFATTFFNASFFSGLDLVTYQSHSLYLSRYPRGREATISWPSPDLKVKNSTPYGILLWPTYDATTLTVHMYSTHFVDVTAGPTQDAKSGVCTRVTTPRVRTYVDGHVDNDSVSALYQPADGVRC